MKRRVEAHFGFIVGLMAQHEARRAAYFTPRGQSYPQAGPDFRDISEGLLSANIVNQLRACGAKQSSPYRGEPIGTGPRIYPVSN